MIISIGEILWDYNNDQQTLGGAPANFAYHMRQLGFKNTLISAIGDDDLGKKALQLLKEYQITPMIETTIYPTGTAHANTSNRNSVEYQFQAQSAWDNLTYRDQLVNLAKECRVLYFGTLAQRNSKTRNTMTQLFKHIPERSLRILDLNIRNDFYSRDLIEHSLNQANVLKVNLEELELINQLFNYQINDESKLTNYLIEHYNLMLLIITQGSKGSTIYTQNECSFVPSTPVINMVDTIGAGDAFLAAFIAYLLKEHHINRAHRFATNYSAYICTQKGGMPNIPEHFKNFES